VKEAAGRDELDQVPPHGARVLVFPDRGLGAVDDVAIVHLLMTGDPRAPRAAWQRFAPMVHRMLKRAFGPAHEIDDLVQDVFLLLFDRVATLREPKALCAFVITLTAYTIRRELRRKRAAGWLQLDDVPPMSGAGADLDSREALRRLYRILDRLGADDRTAFTLRFFEGLELVEVAEAMGVSLATTKRRLAHARSRVASHAQRDAALVEYLSNLQPEDAS